MCSKLFPTFSSIRFSVSGFMWRLLTYLDLSFVQGVKNLLSSTWRLSVEPAPVFEMLSIFHWLVLVPLSKIKLRKVYWFISATMLLHLPLYQYYAIFIPCCVIQLEVRDGDSPRNSFIIENSFDILGFFLFQINLRITLTTVKYWVGILMGIALNL